jgi:transcription initiation factor TFIID subunit 1
MPHAIEDNENENDTPEADDELLINSVLSGVGQADDTLAFLNRDLEVGEKADDAIDFEDISDDDLADEEESAADANELPDDENHAKQTADGNGHADEPDLSDLFGEHGDDDLDDLFGDGLPSDNIEGGHINGVNGVHASVKDTLPRSSADIPSDAESGKESSPMGDASERPSFRDVDYGAQDDPELLEQMELFASHRERVEREDRFKRGGMETDIPPAPQTDEELFKTIWPAFNKEEIPRFGVLLPWKRAVYLSKRSLKPPKPLQSLKVNLDLLQDQERSFKLNVPISNKRKRDEAKEYGILFVAQTEGTQQSSDEEMDLDPLDDNEIIGGVCVQDLRILCEDWDTLTLLSDSPENSRCLPFENGADVVDIDNQLAARRARLVDDPFLSLPMFSEDFGPFDDPELLTAKIAKHIPLDLNDPHLLIDTAPQHSNRTKAQRSGLDMRRDVNGSVTKTMIGKYNFSNDDAYDLLKENHSNKVRSTLGNVTVEHSLPALKLQFPFYRVKLNAREARSFHRPVIHFPVGAVRFEPTLKIKSKKLKGLDIQSMYKESRDLSLADNSHMLLVEYSEECPLTLSNFGMGNKIINYYRRKDETDTSRPKLDVGETQVLLPQDKSPFSIFGNIEPGSTLPTFHNSMYRTPVFRHDPKPTDFVFIRSWTGVGRDKWYIRNMENLHVAGQQFPSLEVPGTHSRKVTEAAKRRLRMISYRKYKKNATRNARAPWLSNEMIRHHLPGTDIAQNRGKMREFMAYNKETGSWQPKPGDVIPDESTMRTWIKPEDICLLDAMQVGDRHLQDVGYNQEDGENDAAGDDDDEKDAQGIDQQLAPWQTTKNFINACQGKAMLQLHGEGDPSGRGEAFSFIKTSMKGGFKAIGESVEDRLDAKRLKELGGHSYNVARQQKAYDDAIKRIWDAQARSLSSNVEHSDIEMDIDEEEEPEHRMIGQTPRSEVGTPSILFSRRDDETGSQFSSNSEFGKVLKIIRTVVSKYGKEEKVEEIVHDPKVIAAYLRRRRVKELQSLSLNDYKPTGDAEFDSRQRKA